MGERERSSSPPLSLSLGHPLVGQTLRREIEMTGTEETPVVASKAEEVVKLNNSFKEACVITKSEQVRNILLLAVSVYFICRYETSDLPTDHFLLNNIFVPLFIYNIVMIFCTYMLVVIFSPHNLVPTHHTAHNSEVITFNNAYLIFASAILSYALFDSALVISYICAIYFRAERLQRFLSKYWFVRLFIMIGVDLLLVCYYLHCLILMFHPIFLIYLLLVLAKAIILMWYLKREICEPMSWKMKVLDDQKVPDSAKVKQAVRIMEMKGEVKEVADSAGAA